MRLLYQLHVVAFLAALAQAAATGPKDDGLAARFAAPEAAVAPAPKKRLLGICIFGLRILGDCDNPPPSTTPQPVPSTSFSPSPSVSGPDASATGSGTASGNATGASSATPTVPPTATPTDPGLLSLTSAPGSAGLNVTTFLPTYNPHTYVYPQPALPWRSVRTPDSVFKPTGGTYFPSYKQTRRYTLEIDKARGALDGFERQMYVVNGQYPGPLLEANQGDDMEITVINRLDMRQTLHFHGIRQNGTNWGDGIPGIHQCAIPPGGRFTYKFNLNTESGTYWYHSHYGNTLADGILGAMIIHSKDLPMQKNRDYDDERVVYLSDWNDNQSMEIVGGLKNLTKTYRGSPIMSPPDALLINGAGQTDCSVAQKGPRCTRKDMSSVKVRRGQKVRLRLLNVGAEALIRYSIDGHTMTIIEVDDTPVEPLEVREIDLWPAQRYSVIVTMDKGGVGASFFMRAQMAQYCLPGPEFLPPMARSVKAKLQYTDWLGLTWFGRDPVDNPWPDLRDPATEPCRDMDEYHTFTPSVIEDPPQNVQGVSVFNSAFGIFIDHKGTPYIGFGMNDVAYTNYINNPLMKQVMDGKSLNPEDVAAHTWPNSGAYDLIINQHDPAPIAHPYHLHGRPFHIIARGQGSITAADLPNIQLNTVNPLRRDTFSIGSSSWAVLRIITDDPGVWPLHCHIGWHVGVGKLGVLVVRPEDLKKQQLPAEWYSTCAVGGDINEIDFVRRDPITGLTRKDGHRGAEIAKREGGDDDTLEHALARRKAYDDHSLAVRQAYQHNETHWWIAGTGYSGLLPEGV